TSMAQLDEDIDAFGTPLSPELLAAIDALRWELGDPAI
ncbi:MAG: aldo/keto reductase, partial [Giesbergeria sp.]